MDVKIKEKTKSIFNSYELDKNLFDEVFSEENITKKYYLKTINQFSKLSLSEYNKLNEFAKISFFNQGVTFAVYSDTMKGVERIFPFDLVPRIIPIKEWEQIEKGVLQRNQAINLFLYDIYHEKKILRSGVVPPELIFSAKFYNREMNGFAPPGNIYTHICGTDIIRHSDGHYYVLEDNVRCPSGVSYVLSNRETMKRVLPDFFLSHPIMPIDDYPLQLLDIIKSVAPEGIDDPTCVVMSPGMYNSAYFEHSFLAQSMGIQLVEGRDLFVDKNFVYMNTIYGPQRVDVIYRRVDDDFMDPLVYRADSYLGVPGIISAYRAGNVTLINAPGTGASDDKAVYAYVPDIIKYYLGEEPILNNVHTYRCEKDSDYKYVIENIHNLVIKPVDESGGYGILIGTKATKEQIAEYKKLIAANRRKYIAQPIMSLSVHPTFIEESGKFEQRHIDLRTFCLMGRDKQYVLKGGLTRVALKKGSLVVNSSQGGGSKDTWVLQK
ncbi:MAG: circularly permuted type 2 ATP-grasp protein [Cytophagaceae bacterium]|nr:circularly permuted type 2 ATP-grasp protein [Cytophagaceae bacterium]MDW8456989.1 circularly permuted type 2 ATP-grasp protein [Cytophagaceae bacterium]